MNNKRLYIALGIMFISLTINACSETSNSSVVPTLSDSVIEIEIPEPIDSLNKKDQVSDVDTSQGNGEYQDTEVNGDIVDGTALTQEEIEQLKSASSDSSWQKALDAYESITETGEWVDPVYHGTYNEVVGKPGDTSWRQMTDEEAKAILDEHPNNVVAKAELANGTWNMKIDGKVYFDPYKYLEDSEKAMDDISDQLITSENFED